MIHMRIASNYTVNADINSTTNSVSNFPTTSTIIHHVQAFGLEVVCAIDVFFLQDAFQYNESSWVVSFSIQANDDNNFISRILKMQNSSLIIGNIEYILYFDKSLKDLSITPIDSAYLPCNPRAMHLFARPLRCPYVYLDRNRTKSLIKGLLCLREDRTFCFSDVDYDEDGDYLIVCADKWFKTESSKSTQKPGFDEVETILSFVCSLLSMISLCFTLFTFSCFSSLRTLPGLNTMGLSVSLLLAHGFYAYGQKQIYHKVICVILGILTHFLWLNSIMWMNICCVHMFRVFGSKSMYLSNKRNTFVLYILYTMVVSGIIVTMYILYQHFSISSIGYGGHICYINDNRMVLYFFAIPVALVISTNLALFVAVIIKISRLPNVSEAMSKQRNYMTIYAKLTTLTGITWVLGFIYQHALVKELSYVYIVLNGCQGVYIMIAFSMNEKVRQLYFEKFRFKRSRTHSDGTHTKETIVQSQKNGTKMFDELDKIKPDNNHGDFCILEENTNL